MMPMPSLHINITWAQVNDYGSRIAAKIAGGILAGAIRFDGRQLRLYGIPRGGLYAVQSVALCLSLTDHLDVEITEDPKQAHIVIDDILDSGKTREQYEAKYGVKPFFALVNKQEQKTVGQWYSFPWERSGKNDDETVTDNITRIIQYIGDDPNRAGLRETPSRVVKSYAELFSGYRTKLDALIKTFDSGCDEMVLIKDVEFCSMCEHHMLPFIGRGHIAYIPSGKIIGLSKLARILDACSRKLQNQEQITRDVTTVLDFYLKPLGSACVLEAKHLCMSCRGVNKQHSVMVTSSLTGVFREKAEVRAEFMQLIKG